MNNNPYELYHFGILGMKWGIRRYQNEDGSLTPEGKIRYRNSDGSYTEAGRLKKSKGKVYSDDYWNAHDKKKVEYMSDKELQNRTKRLQLERQYKEFTATPGQKVLKSVKNNTINAGRTFVNVAIISAATTYGAYKLNPYVRSTIDKGVAYVSKLFKR